MDDLSKITTTRAFYDAMFDLYNALGRAPQVRQADTVIDIAYRKVWYEAMRANGTKVPPFDEYLKSGDFYAVHNIKQGE